METSQLNYLKLITFFIFADRESSTPLEINSLHDSAPGLIDVESEWHRGQHDVGESQQDWATNGPW